MPRTGVGGIIRDIVSIGARPINLLNSLRFGELSVKQNQRLLKGVVRGIGGYGNCIGIPTNVPEKLNLMIVTMEIRWLMPCV